MHLEILSDKQREVLPYLENFKRSYYIVGGTAIAFHIGHRRSIDFDLFTAGKINKVLLKSKLNKIPFSRKSIFEDYDQLHIIINDIKTTFFSYPYKIKHPVTIKNFLSMPNLIDLAAMKAYALGRRSKWKDYVDLFYLIKSHFTVKEISEKAKEYYNDLFSEKLFREQLAFHKDINYSEPVEYIGASIHEEEIRSFLIEKAIDIF
jgi:hypothetical protein